MLFIETGSLSLAETSFSMRGMKSSSEMKYGNAATITNGTASPISMRLSHLTPGQY